MKKRVICLLGPTATGKTETALHLSDHLPIHIISVDSVMIYKGMNIGSAKPDRQILRRYPHALVDILAPTSRYSAAEFREDALREIEYAFAVRKIPLLVGGTFLYFQALLKGLSPIPETPNEKLAELNNRLEIYGVEHLHQELSIVDPESAERIEKNDAQRITRALAVYETTRQTMGYYRSLPKEEPLPYEYLKIALHNYNSDKRNDAIKTRYNAMIDFGLVDEVRTLLKTYPELNLNYPSLRAVGYRQIYEYLQQKHTLSEAIDLAIIATRQYAKRQRTWLRGEEDIINFDVNEDDYQETILETVTKWLNQ